MMSDPNSQTISKHSKLNKFWAAAAIIGVSVVLILVGVRLFQNDVASIALGESPQEFTLTTYSGEHIDTSGFRGKVILINFWASWCTTCDEEALLLETAWQAYQADESENVAFLGVAYMDTEPASLAFLSTYGVTYPNGPDLRGEISKLYQVRAVPETYILDQEGTLRYIKFGPFASLTEIFNAIDSAIVPQRD